jgi:hydroxymethylglutaryl-CoA lyase
LGLSVTGPTPLARTTEVARQAVSRGADALCLGDTVGTTTPRRVLDLVQSVRDAAPGYDVGVHFDNTRGTGIANAFAALQAGVTSLDASVGGLGGCPFAPGASGNIATKELAYLLDGCGVSSGIDLDALLIAAGITQRAVGHELPSSLYRAGGRSRPLGVASVSNVV